MHGLTPPMEYYNAKLVILNFYLKSRMKIINVYLNVLNNIILTLKQKNVSFAMK